MNTHASALMAAHREKDIAKRLLALYHCIEIKQSLFPSLKIEHEIH